MYVQQFYNKNQFIITSNNIITFQSYDSIICEYNQKTKELKVFNDWNYSKTTSKHFYLFLQNYCYNLYKKIENAKNKKSEFQKILNDYKIINNNNFTIIYL